MLSPYSRLLSDFAYELNLEFRKLFELANYFKYYDITPGERCGIVSCRSIKNDTSRSPADRNVRSGIQHYLASFEVLIVAAADRTGDSLSTRTHAELVGIQTMVDLLGITPMLKETLASEIVYDIMAADDVQVVNRQSTRPPHSWIVDVTTNIDVKFIARKNNQGYHIPFNGETPSK